MTTEDTRLTELLDREAIRDCIFRYCRGIDRVGFGQPVNMFQMFLNIHGQFDSVRGSFNPCENYTVDAFFVSFNGG